MLYATDYILPGIFNQLLEGRLQALFIKGIRLKLFSRIAREDIADFKHGIAVHQPQLRRHLADLVNRARTASRAVADVGRRLAGPFLADIVERIFFKAGL